LTASSFFATIIGYLFMDETTCTPEPLLSKTP
jgi:hypothetical protein